MLFTHHLTPWKLLFPNSAGSLPQVWLRGSLANGQVFNFSCNTSAEDGVKYEVWSGVVGKCLVLLKQKEYAALQDEVLGSIQFHCQGSGTEDEHIKMLRRFFRADVDTVKLYQEWSSSCSRFRSISPKFPGIRLLDQDPVECLFSFIASTNNNISRISSMLKSLRLEFGEPIEGASEEFKVFPNVKALSRVSEENLRSLGFGYRAKYVTETAKLLSEKADDGLPWLLSLRSAELTNEFVHNELTQLAGVGPKVADCVALFSCNRLNIVPVDVHVYTLAKRNYDPDCF